MLLKLRLKLLFLRCQSTRVIQVLVDQMLLVNHWATRPCVPVYLATRGLRPIADLNVSSTMNAANRRPVSTTNVWIPVPVLVEWMLNALCAIIWRCASAELAIKVIRSGGALKSHPLFNLWKHLKILVTPAPVVLIQIVNQTDGALEELLEPPVSVLKAILAIHMVVAAAVLNVQQTQTARPTLLAAMISNVWTLAGMCADWRPSVRW